MSGLLDRRLKVLEAPKVSTRGAALDTRALRAREWRLTCVKTSPSPRCARRAPWRSPRTSCRSSSCPRSSPLPFRPSNNVVDLAVAVVLFRLLGWHWALLPAFVAEAIPLLDLAPTWTAAVFLATRGQAVSAACA